MAGSGLTGRAGGRPANARDALPSESREPLIREAVLATAEPGTTPRNGVRFRFTVPSSRLRVVWAVGLWGKNSVDISASKLKSVTPFVRDEQGSEAPMQPLDLTRLTTTNLPQSLDANTGARSYVVEVDLVRPAGMAPGVFKAVVWYEPTNEMSTEEWNIVQHECDVSGPRPALAIGP